MRFFYSPFCWKLGFLFFLKRYLFEIPSIQSYILYTCMKKTFDNRLKIVIKKEIDSFCEILEEYDIDGLFRKWNNELKGYFYYPCELEKCKIDFYSDEARLLYHLCFLDVRWRVLIFFSVFLQVLCATGEVKFLFCCRDTKYA